MKTISLSQKLNNFEKDNKIFKHFDFIYIFIAHFYFEVGVRLYIDKIVVYSHVQRVLNTLLAHSAIQYLLLSQQMGCWGMHPYDANITAVCFYFKKNIIKKLLHERKI